MRVQTLAHKTNHARVNIWRRSLRGNILEARRDVHWQSLVHRVSAGQVFQQLGWSDRPVRWAEKKLRRGRTDEIGNRAEARRLRRFIFRSAFAFCNESTAHLP